MSFFNTRPFITPKDTIYDAVEREAVTNSMNELAKRHWQEYQIILRRNRRELQRQKSIASWFICPRCHLDMRKCKCLK